MEEKPKHPTVFDTDQQQLGEVYAKALVGFGQKAGKLDGLLSDLAEVTAVLDEVPRLKQALESPRIAVSEKQGLLDRAFGGRVDKDLLNFLKIVVGKGRSDCLAAMSASSQRMYDELSGRVVASVTTAEAIDESVQARVAEKLGALLGKKVELRPQVDPTIIGGMIVRVGDTVYDASVLSELSQMRVRAVKRVSDAIRGSIDKFITT